MARARASATAVARREHAMRRQAPRVVVASKTLAAHATWRRCRRRRQRLRSFALRRRYRRSHWPHTTKKQVKRLARFEKRRGCRSPLVAANSRAKATATVAVDAPITRLATNDDDDNNDEEEEKENAMRQTARFLVVAAVAAVAHHHRRRRGDENNDARARAS